MLRLGIEMVVVKTTKKSTAKTGGAIHENSEVNEVHRTSSFGRRCAAGSNPVVLWRHRRRHTFQLFFKLEFIVQQQFFIKFKLLKFFVIVFQLIRASPTA
jgi:hypothetical protein